MSRSEQIFSTMKGEFERIGQCTLPEASDASIKLQVIASQLAALFEKLDFYDQQIYPQTATGEYLVKHGTARGIYKKEATPAKGQVVFTLQAILDHELTIPQGTLCACSKNSDVLFQTITDITIPAGNTTAIAAVESTETGSNTSVAAKYIDVLVSPINGVASVSNPYPITSGTDLESDESYRRRVVESYQKISNGANLNYYEVFAKSRSDVWHAKAFFETETINQIKLYVENAGRTISDATIAQLQADIEDARELGVKVTVSRPILKEIPIEVVAYVDNLGDQSTYHANIHSELISYIQSLTIGQRFSLSHAAAYLLKIPGILDVSFSKPTASVIPAENEIITFFTIDVMIQKG